MSTQADIEGLLNGLITLTEVDEDKKEDFFEAQRTAFDTQQANPSTAIDIVQSGITIVEPPADCPEQTFKAREELQEFSDDLSDILTYKSWL